MVETINIFLLKLFTLHFGNTKQSIPVLCTPVTLLILPMYVFGISSPLKYSTSPRSNTAPVAGSGNCLNFDGANGYVTMGTPALFDNMNTVTLEAWIYAKTAGENSKGRIFDKANGVSPTNGWQLFTASTGALEFLVDYSSTDLRVLTATNLLSYNTWNHVALTWDGTATATNVHIYVNGTEASYATQTNGSVSRVTDAGQDLLIGNETGQTRTFDGYIDEARIWNTERTQSEIQSTMNRLLNGDETNLIGYWRFDHSSGTTLTDITSNGNNGTLTSMSGTTWLNSTVFRLRSTDNHTPVIIGAGYDPEGTAVTLSNYSAPTKGTLSFYNTEKYIIYTPTLHQSGTDNFIFQISDGSLTDTFSMSISISDVNAQPVALSGKCLDFDKLDDYVNCGSPALFDDMSAFTVEAWVYAKSAGEGSSGTIIGKLQSATMGTGWILWNAANGVLEFRVDYDPTYLNVRTNTNALSYNTWNHVAVAWDGTGTAANVNIYINGTEVSHASNQNGSSSRPSDAAYNLYIGNESGTTTTFDGFIDEVRLWNTVRTQTEIDTNRFIHLTGTESNLIGYWNFNQTSGLTLPDLTIYGNDGTLNSNMTNADWIGSGAWKSRTTTHTSAFTYSAGYDPDPRDNITLSLLSSPSKGSVTLNSIAKTISYVPEYDPTASADQTFTYKYQISDGDLTDTATMSITVQYSGSYIQPLLPITVRNNVGTGSSDTCLVYTDKWSLVFDEDNGGGIKFLSNSSNGAGTNQLTNTLFYLCTDNLTGYNVPNTISISECNSLFCKLIQTQQFNSQQWQTTYTVYGNGIMYIRVEKDAPFATYTPGNGLEFRIQSNISSATNRKFLNQSSTANQTNYLVLIDTSSTRFDLLFAPFEDWSQASALSSTSSSYYGFLDNDWSLSANASQAWEFMLDFSNSKLTDTSGMGARVDNYRSPDSLEYIVGTNRMEQAWEEQMKGQWRFNDGSSGSADADTAADASGLSHHGIIKGGTWSSSGKFGNALSLNGTSDTVGITSASDFNSQYVFTICAWIKKSNTTDADALIFGKKTPAANCDFKLVTANNKLKLYVFNTSVTGTTDLGTGWRHVAATYDKHTWKIRLFVDGKPDKISEQQPIPLFGTGVVSIGNGFTGLLDDVRFYSKSISDATIRAIYLNGYKPDEGSYMLRADNNSSVYFKIDGTTTAPRYFPIVQIANYWGTVAPPVISYNGQWLVTTGECISALNSNQHTAFVGFNKTVSTTGTYIYIDDLDSTGALKINPTKKMYWGTSGSDFYVQNFSGTTFGAENSNQFHLYWKMGTASPAKDGEISRFKSSNCSPSVAVAAATNLSDSSKTGSTLGYFSMNDGTRLIESSAHVSATPGYTVIESTSVRVRVKINERTITNTTSFTITSTHTIYPTGQIFRYDSVYSLSTYTRDCYLYFQQLYTASASTVVNERLWRAGMYNGGTTNHDMAIALLSTKDKNSVKDLFTGATDSVGYSNSSSYNYSGLYFKGSTDLQTADAPFLFTSYIDIQRNGINSIYIDSVCDGVQNITYAPSDVITGTKDSTTAGDFDQDGFNEAEGAYVIKASNNSINLRIRASALDPLCRFYPAIRIKDYYALYKPKFIHLYTTNDTTQLIEEYGYNCALNTTTHELIIQLDTVLCVTTNLYLSADQDLAVTLSDFHAAGGDQVDTLFWQTESESQNLGFFLYRKLDKNYIDSVKNTIDSTVADSALDPAQLQIKYGTFSLSDTLWNKVNQSIIPGAPSGTSVGPRTYSYIDYSVANYVRYTYKLVSVDFTRQHTAVATTSTIPKPFIPTLFMLYTSFPNPLRSYATIHFDIPLRVPVSLTVYTLQGKVVAHILKPNTILKAGRYSIRWNGTSINGTPLATGPYIYRLSSKKFAQSKMLIILH